MYTNKIYYTDTNPESKVVLTQKHIDSASFQSVLEQETCIQATPGNTETQPAITNYGTSVSSISVSDDLDSIFKQAADTYGISENLLKAVAKAESNFQANATSGAGAMGIMQLMPSTAASLGVTNPYDAAQNIMGGAKYLSQLYNQYNGDVSLTLAAYNAGPGNVNQYGGIPPFTETQNYVNKVLGYYEGFGKGDTAQNIYAMAANNNAVYTINAVPETQVM